MSAGEIAAYLNQLRLAAPTLPLPALRKKSCQSYYYKYQDSQPNKDSQPAALGVPTKLYYNADNESNKRSTYYKEAGINNIT